VTPSVVRGTETPQQRNDTGMSIVKQTLCAVWM